MPAARQYGLRAGLLDAVRGQRLIQRRRIRARLEARLELVRTSGCSAYNCELAAIVEEHRTELMTMDAKILKAFPKIALPMAAA